MPNPRTGPRTLETDIGLRAKLQQPVLGDAAVNVLHILPIHMLPSANDEAVVAGSSKRSCSFHGAILTLHTGAR